MMLGEVDRVDDHFIATKFHALLIPGGSMYVTHQDRTRSGNVTTMSWSGVPIKFNWKSAALAIPRVWLWFLAAAWPFITHYGAHVSKTPNSTWFTMLGFVVVALLLQLPGRLSAAEKDRLRILGRVTGMRIDPAKLQPMTRTIECDNLEASLSQAGIVTTPQGLLAAADSASPAVLGALYTYARYAGDSREWRDAAEALWKRHANALPATG